MCSWKACCSGPGVTDVGASRSGLVCPDWSFLSSPCDFLGGFPDLPFPDLTYQRTYERTYEEHSQKGPGPRFTPPPPCAADIASRMQLPKVGMQRVSRSKDIAYLRFLRILPGQSPSFSRIWGQKFPSQLRKTTLKESSS